VDEFQGGRECWNSRLVYRAYRRDRAGDADGARVVVCRGENGGELNGRTRSIALWAWPVQLVLTIVGLVATLYVQPAVLDNYKQHAIGYLIPVVVFGSLGLMIYAIRKGLDKIAFVGSALYIVGMLVGAAFALYPVVLPASTDPAYSLTIYNTAAGHHGLTVGITWWTIGMVLALGYFTFLFRMFRGKVRLEGEGY
jgi:cytochrome d ubiquinol oxidase subunit II